MKKKNKYPAVLTGLFCAFLGCGALTSVFMPKKSFSETENRYLAQMPSLTWQSLKSGAFGTEYENLPQRPVSIPRSVDWHKNYRRTAAAEKRN